MKVELAENGDMVVEEIPLFLAEVLRQIVNSPELGSAAAEERLYPDPAPGDEDESITSDWKAHVQPGMHDHFSAARSVVEADLKRLKEEGGTFRLEIDHTHVESWLNALNQARLAIAAHHGLSENDMAREEIPVIESQRDLAVFRVHFYGFLQQMFLTQLGYG